MNIIEDPLRPRPRIEVNISQKSSAVALVDSGAFISVAPKELAVSLGLVIKNCGHPPLRALGGNAVPVVGQIYLNIEYQGKGVILFGVPVIDEYGRSLILGQDWIQAVGGISITFKESYFLVDIVQQERDKAAADEDSQVWNF